jgi:hypothetical protein
MKQNFSKLLLILVLVFSVVTSVYAAPIRPDSMKPHNDRNIEINMNKETKMTEPDIVFNGRADSRWAYGRYDQVIELSNYNGHIESAPVPEPLSLVLFGMGMIGVGFLARYRKA